MIDITQEALIHLDLEPKLITRINKRKQSCLKRLR